MIKALFLDIDGTLVSFRTHQIPSSAIEALTKAKDKGSQNLHFYRTSFVAYKQH